MATFKGNAWNNLINRSADTAADSLSGLGGNDSLVGGSGNDTLDGGTGNDTMIGGLGDDLYIVNSAKDKVVEAAKGGRDTIWSSVTLNLSTFATQVENLLLSGSAALSGTGNALDNVLTGNSGNNTLSGLDGNDLIDGKAGKDKLLGGNGADTLDGGDGIDTLEGGTGNDVISGGLGADAITFNRGDGQDLIHADTQDTITLGAGITQADLKIGQLGASAANAVVLSLGSTDTITLDNAGSWDGLSLVFADGSRLKGADIYKQSTEPANLSLTGTAGADTLTGGDGRDTLSGGAGDDSLFGGNANDLLDGGTGQDTLDGGAGNDTMIGTDAAATTYYIDSLADVIIEKSSGQASALTARDQLYTSVSISALQGDIEDATLMFGAGSLTGNALANVLSIGKTGSALYGAGGDDTLKGGFFGPNYLDGGEGNDTYVFHITANGDNYTINDSGSANDHDLIVTNNRPYSLTKAVTIEDLEILGNGVTSDATEFIGEGNELNNTITSHVGGVTLHGRGGNDVLVALGTQGGDNILQGDAGNDTLIGSVGTDTFVFNRGDGHDLIHADGQDAIILGAGITQADIQIGQLGATAANSVVLSLGSTDSITLDAAGSWGSLLLITSDGTRLMGDAILARALLPSNQLLTGSSGNDSLTGSNGQDTLDGSLGDDTLNGGAGNDTYMVDSALDVIVETSGIDTVISSVSLNLGTSAPLIENATVKDAETVTTAQGSIPQSPYQFKHIHTLKQIDLTGNGLDNILIGGDAQRRSNTYGYESNSYVELEYQGSIGNVLQGMAGNDTLEGRAGDDTIDGGSGADTIIFNLGDGQDLVHADSQDTITLGAGILRSDLYVSGTDGTGTARSVTLALATGNSITLDKVGTWDDLKLQFADGTNLTGREIRTSA
jgi:Ca2+-binding RTX toxin-like protein